MSKILVMLRLAVLFSFFSLNSMLGFSQAKVVIVDSYSNEALPYVLVEFPALNKAVYTSSDGYLSIPLNCDSKDSLSVYYSGYHQATLDVGSLSDTIYLSPMVYDLPEVIIFSQKATYHKAGFLKENKRKEILIGYEKFAPVRVAVRIANEIKATCRVNKLLYRFRLENDSYQYMVRPQLYSVGNDGKPSEPLLLKSQLFKLDKKEGSLEYDCSLEELAFPANGIFVVLEVLDVYDKKGNSIALKNGKYPFLITCHYKNEVSTYLFSTQDIGWSSHSIGLPVDGTLKVYLNAAFGIELKCTE